MNHVATLQAEAGVPIQDASTGEAAVIETTFSTEGPILTITQNA
jgi:hypothetical protein